MAELKTTARPYAKAAFAHALAADAAEQWSSTLQLLSALVRQSAVAQLLANPALTAEQKGVQLSGLLGEGLTPSIRNFISVLAENKRLSLLPEISQLFDELRAEQESVVNVLIKSAYPVDSNTKEQLANALKQKLQRDVAVETAVDDSLMGGVLIKAGDIVIDSSVKGRLAKLAEAMNL